MSSSTSNGGTNPKDRLGIKKPPVSTLPPAGVIYGTMAMRSGALKYGPYNWRENSVQARIYIDAIARHALAYLDGEEAIPDSGVPHLGAIIASAAILADAYETGCLVDDRPVKGVASALIERISAAITSAGGAVEQEIIALTAVFNTPTHAVLEDRSISAITGPIGEPNTGAALEDDLLD